MNLQGSPVDYLVVFLGGVLASFSPCVYPLIPVTIGVIGIDASRSRLAGFTLSAIYVTGIAFVYALLGLIAVLSGSLFGAISAHPLTRVIAGAVFIFFGLLLWDIFPLKTLQISTGFSLKKKLPWEIFILGLSSGLVISPCTSPILGSILIIVASRKNILYATTLLLTFAYGMGLILILAGTFSRILLGLSKSAAWTQKIKKLSGLILAGMGAYFILSAF
jgi:thiol:disulfide interchange protein DsbD